MALSGSFYKNVGPRWRVQVEWSATQNVSANESRVTARLYWISLDRYGAVYSSTNDPASITINGNTETTSEDAGLSANQKKHILTHSVTVPHNSDGTKTFTLSAYFDLDVTLAGVYYGRQSLSDSITLNTIPRESSLASSPSWDAGHNKTFTINRHSTSFRHEIEVYVRNSSGTEIHVKHLDIPAGGTSVNSSFSFAENEKIYDIINARDTAATYIIVQTYSGSTWIGSKYYDGTVTAEYDSYMPGLQNSFDIGDTIPVTIRRYNSKHTHTIRLKNGSTTLKTYTGQGDSCSFSTASIASTLYALTANSKSINLTMEIETFWGSEKVRNTQNSSITARVTNSNPTFSASLTYADINATTLGITDNSQYIIANKSSVRVTLPSGGRATAKNGASMDRYVASLAGKTVTKDYTTSTITFDFGEIGAQTNQSVVITAVDSRGFSTPVTKVITVIPYNDPGIAVNAARVNGFEADTVVSLSGTVQSIQVDGVEKNSIQNSRLRYKESAGSAWQSWISFPVTGFPGFTATDKVLTLNRLNSYDIEVEVTDVLGTTNAIRTVSSGKPLLFIDELLGSIGMGEFPTKPNQLLLTHQIDFAAGRFGSGNYAMDLNKGNVHGANGFFFQDTTTGTEGVNFLKTGRPEGSRDFSDYDTLNMVDGALKINGVAIAHQQQGLEHLWEGAWYMQDGQTCTPSKPIDHCPTGWILVWSEYNGGAVDNGWSYTHIPKEESTKGGATWLNINGAYGAVIQKYIFVGPNDFTGHSVNNDSPNNQAVLRAVLAY